MNYIMTQMYRRIGLFMVVLALVAAIPPAEVGAQPLSEEELAGFFDPRFAKHMATHSIPGAMISVVMDGEILFTRGYGYANVADRTPVDPERTLFNIGSVTKLFTATAAMQQVEAVQLDLHTDVNQYLSAFTVPATFTEPITLSHLLTHTAGFDERIIGWVAPSPEDVEPLAENLQTHLPPRIRPPGVMAQYSNHGISLAGHLVEQASGLRFPEYVASHIWEPLGMRRTSYHPVGELAADMGTGYGYGFGENQPGQRVFFNLQPAGGIWTTATDMAAFMMAHLQQGEYEGRSILAPETVAQMHRNQFTAHPAVNGHAYGFFEHSVGERRGVQHGGEDVEGFVSLLYLLPSEGVGVFVSYNSPGGLRASSELILEFLDHYFPTGALQGEVTVDQSELQSLVGSYQWIRNDRHTFARTLLAVLTARLNFRIASDGVLVSTAGITPFMPETRWIPVEPLVFRAEGGTETIAFERDEAGRVTHLYLGWPQPITMQRLAWYEHPALHVGTLGFLLATFFSVVLGWPAVGLYRRLRRRRVERSIAVRTARRVAGGVSALGLVFLLGMPLVIATTFLDTYTVSLALQAMLLLPLIVAVATIPLVFLVVRLWREREGSLPARVQYTVVALAAVVMVPFLAYWRLLGFHF